MAGSTLPRRRRALGWTSSWRRGPTSSTWAGSRRAPAPSRCRPRCRSVGCSTWCVTRPAAARASRSTPTTPEVAAACLDAGACVVNDVSCLLDGALARVVAASGAALVLMHARGTQKEMPGLQPVPRRRVRRRRPRRVRRVGDGGRAGALRGRARATRSSWTPASASRRTRAIASSSWRASARSSVRSAVPVAVGASRKSFLAVAGEAAGVRNPRAPRRPSGSAPPSRRPCTPPAQAPRSFACTTCVRRARRSTSSAPSPVGCEATLASGSPGGKEGP